MKSLLIEKLREALHAIAPLVIAVCLLQVAVIHAPLGLFLQFLGGSILAVVGMMLLFAGIDLGILPMGRYAGAELPKRGSLTLIIAVAFSIGVAVTVAEPDVLVLSGQIDVVSRGAISGTVVLYVLATGLGVCAAIAMVRIILGWSMRVTLTIAFALAILLALVAQPEYVSLAFDSGSVTTGVLSAPVIIALAGGVTSVLAGRSAVADGFGILGFMSVGPIISVQLMGIFWQ